MENPEDFESTGDETLDAYIQMNEEQPEEVAPTNALEIEEPDYSFLDDFEDDEDESTIRQYYGNDGVQAYRAAPLKQMDKDVAQKGYDYLTKVLGQGKVLAAALVGQMMKESGGNPKAVHDNGTGYGLFGHRDPTPNRGRKTKLFSHLGRSNKPEFFGQLDYAVKELATDYPSTYQKVNNTDNIDYATETLMTEWESPHPKYADAKTRKMWARSVYHQYGGIVSNISQSPWLQQNKLTSSLNNGIPYSNFNPPVLNRAEFNQTTHEAFLEEGAPIDNDLTSGLSTSQYEAIDQQLASNIDRFSKGLEVADQFEGTMGQTISAGIAGAESMVNNRNNFLNAYKERQRLLQEQKEDYNAMDGQNKQKEIWT
jgi:hypothetical protein